MTPTTGKVSLSQHFVYDDDFSGEQCNQGAESQSILEEPRGEKEKNPVQHDGETLARQVINIYLEAVN